MISKNNTYRRHQSSIYKNIRMDKRRSQMNEKVNKEIKLSLKDYNTPFIK